MVTFNFSVRYGDFNDIIATPRGPMKTPYALAFCVVIAWMLSSTFRELPHEKIELIFDQGVLGRERNINAAYEGMMESLPQRYTGLLTGRPRFEDDRKFLPLQMADLLAWHCRRDYYEQITSQTRLDSRVWDALRTLKGRAIHYGVRELIDFKRRREEHSQLRLSSRNL